MTGGLPALVIAGEQWEAPFAAATLAQATQWLPETADVFLPPELAGLAGPAATVIGPPPDRCRFRGFQEILADLRQRLRGRRCVVLPAGCTLQPAPAWPAAPAKLGPRRGATSLDGGPAGLPAGLRVLPPPHGPPQSPRHLRRRVGPVEIWTADTGQGYFAALPQPPVGPRVPVWESYGADAPVFAYNTNRFTDERAPAAHDDYFLLGSGLLGARMLTESGPPPRARVIVYDIHPGQLAWSRLVFARAGTVATLPALVDVFAAQHPEFAVRDPMPHEWANVAAQSNWYESRRHAIAGLAGRVTIEWLEADLLWEPRRVLGLLRPERSVFFMYLDLFVVWQVRDDPPWIVEFPALAQSLEDRVRQGARSASFLPGPASTRLQLAGSPLLGQGC